MHNTAQIRLLLPIDSPPTKCSVESLKRTSAFGNREWQKWVDSCLPITGLKLNIRHFDTDCLMVQNHHKKTARNGGFFCLRRNPLISMNSLFLVQTLRELLFKPRQIIATN